MDQRNFLLIWGLFAAWSRFWKSSIAYRNLRRSFWQINQNCVLRVPRNILPQRLWEKQLLYKCIFFLDFWRKIVCSIVKLQATCPSSWSFWSLKMFETWLCPRGVGKLPEKKSLDRGKDFLFVIYVTMKTIRTHFKHLLLEVSWNFFEKIWTFAAAKISVFHLLEKNCNVNGWKVKVYL